MALRKEKMQSRELLGTTNASEIVLDELCSIEGIERVSPIIKFDSEIQFKEYKLSCQIRSVYSNFINATFLEGHVYEDNSNMPVLVLNKAAAESFVLNENDKVTVSSNTNVIMSINGKVTNALICGIFEDKKDTPVVYMSYDFASKSLPRGSSIGLIFSLANIGTIEHIISSLQRQGITAYFDQIEIIRWELLGQQAWEFALSSIGSMICASVLFYNDRSQARRVHQGEKQALLLSGLEKNDITTIFSLRIVVTVVCCTVVAISFAGLTGFLSWVSIAICVTNGLIYCIFVINREPKYESA